MRSTIVAPLSGAAFLLLVLAGCFLVPSTPRPEQAELIRQSGRNNTKVVVFVHGFLGDYRATWGSFPQLILDDPELRDFDIFLWGYPSGLLGRQPSVALVGQALKTVLNTRLQGYDRIYVVAHSLGGVVVQAMVVDELMAGHADALRRIRHIVLFGTPNQGLELPRIVSQLSSSAYDMVLKPEQIDRLRGEWIERVYKPTIRPGEESSKLRIPVTPVVGLQDTLVPIWSARSFFRDPEPETVPGDHVTMKEPQDRAAAAYLVVKQRLLEPVQWRRVGISVGDEAQRTRWSISWRDVFWLSARDGWLCGAIQEGGGSGDVGTGLLLTTSDGGVNWRQQARFNSGRGEFTWGPQGTRLYTWSDVGPINHLVFYKRVGAPEPEAWAATATGVYVSRDGGRTWERSTPPPDHPERYAFFGRLATIEGLAEVYAVGWQGIAHWSSLTGRWRLQKPTYFYDISAVATVGGSENRTVWAVGRAGRDEQGDWGDQSRGALYRLAWPENRWERVPLPAIVLERAQTFSDIVAKNHDTVFVVGQKGLALRGSRQAAGVWQWVRLSTPTSQDLRSIALDGTRLWVVGGGGTILTSTDDGEHWTQFPRVVDDSGAGIELTRVRFFGTGGWIVGNGVVLRSELPY